MKLLKCILMYLYSIKYNELNMSHSDVEKHVFYWKYLWMLLIFLCTGSHRRFWMQQSIWIEVGLILSVKSGCITWKITIRWLYVFFVYFRLKIMNLYHVFQKYPHFNFLYVEKLLFIKFDILFKETINEWISFFEV